MEDLEKYLDKAGLASMYKFICKRFGTVKKLEGMGPDSVGNVNLDLTQSVVDSIYPIGAVYLSLSNTNPSTFIGGRWTPLDQNAQGNVEGTGGYCLVTAGSDFPVPNQLNSYYKYDSFVKGNNTITLQENNIPLHTHSASFSVDSVGDHKHNRGTMNITGRTVSMTTEWNPSGAFYITGEDSGDRCGCTEDGRYIDRFQASRAWTGTLSSEGDHTHKITGGTLGDYGEGKPFDYMPESIPVWVWVRIG